MLTLFVLAALQAPSDLATDLRALDDAHEAWMRCVLAAARSLAVGGEDPVHIKAAAYRACEREEAAWRKALIPLHPEASAADIADSVEGSKRREAFYIDAVIAEARR